MSAFRRSVARALLVRRRTVTSAGGLTVFGLWLFFGIQHAGRAAVATLTRWQPVLGGWR